MVFQSEHRLDIGRIRHESDFEGTSNHSTSFLSNTRAQMDYSAFKMCLFSDKRSDIYTASVISPDYRLGLI